jgi:hypothetical protein
MQVLDQNRHREHASNIRYPAPFSNTVATVLYFCLRTSMTATESGAKEGILQPSSHACYQNNVDVPSPRREYVEALKQVVVTGSSLHGRNAHTRDGSAWLSQTRRNRRALPNCLRSSTSGQPISRECCTPAQAIRHFPPRTTSEPVHRNTPIIFSKVLMSHTGKPRLMEV